MNRLKRVAGVFGAGIVTGGVSVFLLTRSFESAGVWAGVFGFALAFLAMICPLFVEATTSTNSYQESAPSHTSIVNFPTNMGGGTQHAPGSVTGNYNVKHPEDPRP